MNDVSFDPRSLATALQLVGVACGLGAPDLRCETGPEVLRAANLVERLQSRGFTAAWADTILPEAGEADPLKAVAGVCRRLTRRSDTDAERPGSIGLPAHA